MNPSTGTFISMDTYEGSIYDPDTLHKYLYANGNPVKYNDPSGNFSAAVMAAGMAINDTITATYNVHLMGLLSGISNMTVNSLLGKQGMDLANSFLEGYQNGVALAGILYATVAVQVWAFARTMEVAYASTVFGMSAINVVMSTVMFLASVSSHNKKASLVYGTLLVLSAFQCAYAYSTYCEVTACGDKGSATLVYDASESGTNSNNPFYKQGGGSNLDDFMTPHAQKHAYNPNVKSTKNKTQFGENIDVAKLLEDTMLHPDEVIYDSEHNMIKYVKEYDFNISTADTPTGSHRVFINLAPKAGKTNRNSQFPYYGGDK